MKNVLAITVALMMAAMILTPAVGYSINSGDRSTYSITMNNPAHGMTPDMFANLTSFKAPAVGATKMPYSFTHGAATEYSLKVSGVPASAKPQKTPALLGSINKQNKANPVIVSEPEVEVPIEVPAETVAVAEPEAPVEAVTETAAEVPPEVTAEATTEVPSEATAVAAEENVAEVAANKTVDINATNETNTTEVIDLVEVAPLE